MTRNLNEAGSRISSITSSSTDSGATVRPSPRRTASTGKTGTSSSSRKGAPPNMRLKTDNQIRTVASSSSQQGGTSSSGSLYATNRSRIVKEDSQISPTSPSATHFGLSSTLPTSNAPYRGEHRMSDFANYRRELAVLETSGGRIPHIQHNPPTANPSSQQHQQAPWNANPSNGASSTAAAASSNNKTNTTGTSSGAASGGGGMGTTFFNDSSDNLSVASQLSPPLRSTASRGGQTQTPGSSDSMDPSYYNDERRPSIASITTLSSQGSKSSAARGGFRKLQNFFGEEFSGQDGSDLSLPYGTGTGKERSQSYSHAPRPGRERNYSNATDHTRDASPTSSRPRTPIPSSDVVPFLYQEADDIARLGEAPVRDMLSGPDRERYISDASSQAPPKTSSSNRSGHSIAHIAGYHHRHKNSIDDPRSLRPVNSREDSAASVHSTKEHRHGMFSSRSRAPSPSGSGNSNMSKSQFQDGPASPNHHHKRGFLGRLMRHKDYREDSGRLREMPGSSRSLATTHSRTELLSRGGEPPLPGQLWSNVDHPDMAYRPGERRGAASFNNNKSLFKKGRSHRHEDEDPVGPTEGGKGGNMFHLDTNLSDMDGILAHPPPLTPINPSIFNGPMEPEKAAADTDKGFGAWDAPESWAVRGRRSDHSNIEIDEMPQKVEEKLPNYCIRIFRSDDTFGTLQMSLNSTVADVISQIGKKSYVTGGPENYVIVLKKHDMIRVLMPNERPLLIQKRLLQQAGYEERDKIEDIGREDNSYLCRFIFLSARESDFHSSTRNRVINRIQKANHVDLSGQNLITIPISLYSKAPDIISLNLSRNLSLDVPRDFIQSCQNLRDIKFISNEARKLPSSISVAVKLTFLDVSNNRLGQLDHAELGGITGLLKLNLANNRLTRLPPYFGVYKALRSLNISSNFLESFPPFLCEMESLVDIDISFNSIDSFPEEIGKLQNLEKLVITNNRLAGALPETLTELQNLQHLDIKYNAITGINVLTELPKLEILFAEHNSISSFSGGFERLRTLKLNSNPLTKFELTSPLPTLKLLNLSKGQLASIDESFNNMLSLEHLVLDKNYFVSLPAQLGNLRRLEHFSIANNSVGELPPEIGCLLELRVLDVRGNNIRKLPMELWWANKLETLNASSNVLENFPKIASRPPQAPGDAPQNQPPGMKTPIPGGLTPKPSTEALVDESRRPSAVSTTLLSVGPSPVPGAGERKPSVVSVYGKGGRKTSVVSRSTNAAAAAPSLNFRKDSGLTSRLTNTFAGSLRHLLVADNALDENVFEQLALLIELRVLNLSYNDLSDMPQRSIKSWPFLVELYLSGNELTTIPADDLGEGTPLQVLHINGNKFTNLPADISRAKKLAVLDCGSNSLKYNISNVPYDWNWNLNPNLRYLNLSGNKRLEIKNTVYGGASAANKASYSDFNRLQNLRILGLMDVTLPPQQPTLPDQSEDRRVRTVESLAGHLPYGLADTLGKNEHLSTVDLLVPRFNSNDTEILMGLFDGKALSSGGSKIAKYLHENFSNHLIVEMKALKSKNADDTPADALRRAFLALNKDLVTVATQHTEERSQMAHRGSTAPVVLSRDDLESGGVATVIYLNNMDLYVANVGDAQAMLIQTDGTHKILTKKHDPAEPTERQRIRDAGGWVSRSGKLNDQLDVSRAFGYIDLMPAVQAAPYVAHMEMKEQDEMIVIATREVWEYINPGLVADVVRSERGDLMRASQKLRDLAVAYGSSSKIMVMMISVVDLKRRMERSRLHRGQSMILHPSGVPEGFSLPPRRIKKTKEGVLDSKLQRLGEEVPAPKGWVAIVFTDIKNSTNMWEMNPEAMRAAIKAHNEIMRRGLRQVGGYEVKTEGDAFMVSFPTATSALLWCFEIQKKLLKADWPAEVLATVSGQEQFDKDNNLIFKGLSVRMGAHWGQPVCETDPVTRRMDYFGPMVNKASRVSSVADGGQITVSSDFISEVQRCLETYQDNDRQGSVGSEESFDDDEFAEQVRKELRSLMTQGFEVKDMGEKKLKGLENPESVYSLYPHSLIGRIDTHRAHELKTATPTDAEKAVVGVNGEFKGAPVVSESTGLEIDPDNVWSLWRVSLRLEMLCSSLEKLGGEGLQPPETELLERMKSRGGEVTERFVVNFMEHMVSRIETCVSTLALRHMAMGKGPISELNDLRAPMAAILDAFSSQMDELQRYRNMYGPIQDVSCQENEDGEEATPMNRKSRISDASGRSYGFFDDGSETEQEP
ncbi:adenylate cyclase [Zalerion maritima]|uniref:Adenylate cyclase n=1 Tax=Zalerion maritima TaxID=339359 RepID=A0AAD5RX20_9PEZI|nr:adenylate cyclase [Zalerion maritima]